MRRRLPLRSLAAAGRAWRSGQDRGGVGKLGGPFGTLRFQGLPGVALDAGLVAAVRRRPAGGRLAAVPPFPQLAAEQHDRGQARDGQQVHLVQEVGHRQAQDQRDGGHQERQRAAFNFGRRSGQLEPGLPGGRQQPRRPVEIQAQAVRRRVQRGVRRLVARQAEQRAANSDDLARLPLRPARERLAVQDSPDSVVGSDLAAATAVNENPQGERGDGLVPDAHVRCVTAADIGLSRGQPVNRARTGPAHHPDLHQPARLRGDAALRTAQADDRPVPDR